MRASHRVDVIMTTFSGRHEWLIEAIEGVRAQTFEDWRLTIVDDASPDDKTSFIKDRYGDDDRISAVRLSENRGPAGAKRAGIEGTSAAVISLLDDDDRWHPEKLQLQIDRLGRDPHVDAVHTDVNYIDEQGAIIAGVGEAQNAHRARIPYDAMDAREQARSLFVDYSVRSASNAMNRKAYEEAGGHDDTLVDGADRELWVRFAASGHRIAHIARPLYDRRVHGTNISARDRLIGVDAKLYTTEKLVGLFPFLDDLAPQRDRQILRDAVVAGLDMGQGAETRAFIRRAKAAGVPRSRLAAAWAISLLGPLSRPALRAYRRVR